ncbi:MAG: tetratricopeptide repeat protein [Caldilineaceae bacterium]|nr:tetratricopeptide repeat protein [Caldilineaceae bacterium]
MSLSAPTFGELLRQVRRRAGLTQGEFAQRVGFSVAQISRLEKDERLPDLNTVAEKFLPALTLDDEPRLAQRLLTLAAAARGERRAPPSWPQPSAQTVLPATLLESNSHLPANLLPLVGREQDVAVVSKRILDAPSRLLTLLGAPGVGKTQLAITVATKVQLLFADGAHFVPLAAVTNADHVPSAIMAAIGFAPTTPKAPRTQLLEQLRRKNALLVLDNFEQVDTAAPWLAELLGACPGIHLLVTSQTPLRLRIEQRQPVQPLTPTAAVALFLQRAQAIDPSFAPTETVVATITTICLHLDCLPLAIELVAAHVEQFTPDQLLTRLRDQGLDLLADGPRDLPAHQRTLRNAIHRSYALLPQEDQQLFRQLSLFVGGCTLAALHAVYHGTANQTQPVDPALLRSLRRLIRRSLVQSQTLVNNSDSKAVPERFRLLTTLGAYATEQRLAAGEDAAARQRHATYYLALAQQAAQEMQGPAKKAWLAQLTTEHDNLRAALAWALRHAPSLALQLVDALSDFWATRGHDYEARQWLQQALQAHPIPTITRAHVLLTAANLARRQADYAAAQQAVNESLAISQQLEFVAGLAQAWREAGWIEYDLHHKQITLEHFHASLALYRQLDDKKGIANLLLCLGHVLVGQPAHAQELARYLAESLALYRALGHREGLANVLQLQGEIDLMAGHYAVAEQCFQEVLRLWRDLNDKLRIAWAVALVGEAAWHQNQLATAQECYQEAYQIFCELGNKDGCAILCHHQGQVARRQGMLEHARQRYREALALSQLLHNQHMIGRSLAGLGGVAFAMHRADTAAILCSSAQAIFAHLPPFLAPADQAELDQLHEQTRYALGEIAFAQCWQAGQQMTVAEAVTVAETLDKS